MSSRVTRKPLGISWLLLVALALFPPASAVEAGAVLTPSSVTASTSYPGAPPQNAVDGNPYTSWNSGQFASAQPYLQLDLGSDVALEKLELLVSQYPSGHTTHQLVGYTSFWSVVNLGAYSGITSEGMTLSIPIYDHTPVRWVRVITTASPSWVGWYEVKAYQYLPTGWLVADRAQCSVPYSGTFCDGNVRLDASIPTGEYGRVWVAEAPPGAPELGGWIFDTLSGTASLGWIRAGTYKLELRLGHYANGAVISSVYVTGVKQPPPPAKHFGYFGTWEPWEPQTANTVSETILHTNLIWAAPGINPTDVASFKAILNRPEVRDNPAVKIVLDGTNILYGWALCPNGTHQEKTFFDGTSGCNPLYPSNPPLARQRYDAFLDQLTYTEYQKIGWIFPVDEPDLIPDSAKTEADLAAVKQIIIDAARAHFGPSATIPRYGLLYSFLAVPPTGAGDTVGAASADVVAFNCYPISYETAGRDGHPIDYCGDHRFANTLMTNAQRFQRLKQLVPGKKYFLVAETAIPSSQNTPAKRPWLAENLRQLRLAAQSDGSVEGIIGFNWIGSNVGRLGPASLTDAPSFKAAVETQGVCLTRPAQCPP